MQLLELPGIDWTLGSQHQVLVAWRLRKGDHVPNVFGAREHHHQAVDPGGDAAMRWDSVLESLQSVPKPRPDGFLVHAQDLEHPLLQLWVVDPDASTRQLDAVHNTVVRAGTHFERTLIYERQVLRPWRRERMMAIRQSPLVVFFEQVHGEDP